MPVGPDPPTAPGGEPVKLVRDLGLGIGVSASVLWLTFFGTAGAVQMATLIVAVGALIWFSTVEVPRLRDDRGRPNMMLFGLTAVAGALVVTATVFIGTPTVFVIGAIVVAAATIGIVRAIRAAMDGA